MPRPLTGRILERRLRDDTLAFDVVIRKRQVLVGYAPEWSRKRVEALLDSRLLPRAKLGQPWWEELDPSTPTSELPSAHTVTFRAVASDTVHRLQGRYSNKATLNAYMSPIMKHVGPFFSYEGTRDRMLAEITGVLVSEFTKTKMRERDVLRDLSDTLSEMDDAVLRDPQALRDQLDTLEEWTLLVRYGQRGGRQPLAQTLEDDNRAKISLSSRGLSNNEINRCLARLRDILDTAKEDYGIDVGDPTRKRTLPKTDPPRSWLLPHHLLVVFEAAEELDSRVNRSGPDYRHLGRLPLVTLLGLGGPRISEAASLCWDDVHLDATQPYASIKEAKTSAGERNLRLHPPVRDLLLARRDALQPTRGDLIFASASGGGRDRNSIRNRLLQPVLERATELLAARGLPPLPNRVTAHTFRRTYLTYLAWAGVPLRRAMSQAGHKDAKLTLEVYQQDFPDDPAALAQINQWLGIDA
ncbi:MAG TPA: site-specific integrase [Baekduia sp.]|nr:site-specific integrase [Baekduia sp.]